MPDRYDQVAEEARRVARQEARERAERLYAGDWLGGRLLAHGRAPYRFDPQADPSYYVRLQTPYGRQVLWGTDLERAIRESRSHVKIGDAVGVRITTREKIDAERTRNRWQIEQAIHIVRERRVAREILKHPISARRAGRDGKTLTGSYLLIAAAEMLAADRYPDEISRKAFVERLRAAAGLPSRAFGESQQPTPEAARGEPRAAPAAPHREGFARE